jgi:hypothetical protein
MINYGAQFFNARDKNSSHWRNWFRGVIAFESADDAADVIRTGIDRRESYVERYHIRQYIRIRELSGPDYPRSRHYHWIGGFVGGEMITPALRIRRDQKITPQQLLRRFPGATPPPRER